MNLFEEIACDKCGAGLPCRPEVLFDTKVNLEGPSFESATTANGEMGRLWDLGNAECAFKRRARVLFPAGGHGKLDMV